MCSIKANQNALKGLGNNLRIVVAVKEGNIFTPQNLKFLEKVNDEIFFVPGVDRNGMKSCLRPIPDGGLWRRALKVDR